MCEQDALGLEEEGWSRSEEAFWGGVELGWEEGEDPEWVEPEE